MRNFLLIALIITSAPAYAGTRLQCGAIAEALDWNKDDLHGSLAPLDAEICRAVATALNGAPDRFDLQSYPTEAQGLAAVHAGHSDIVVGVTPSARYAAVFGVRYSLPFFQDGQTFMVHRAMGIGALPDLAGKKLCYIDNTDNAEIVMAELAARRIRPIPFPFQEEGEMDAAIMDHHCQATSALLSKLAEARSTFHDARNFVFLPTFLTLTPAVVAVDVRNAHLQAVVDWTISALLQAEFLGIDHASAATLGHSDDPRVQRLLGDDFSTGFGLGLDHAWSRRVIVSVGNYAEIYARSVGPGTALDLPRGLNALWNKGGLMAPLPMQ